MQRTDPWAWGWDAVAAVSTAIAAGAAIIAGIFAFATWRHDRAMFRRIEEGDRRNQAELVSIWCDPKVSGIAHGDDPMHWRTQVSVMVENRSAAPILNVWRKATISFRVGKEVNEVQISDDDTTRVVPPDITIGHPPRLVTLNRGPNEPEILNVSTQVLFTDARGQRWMRDFDGTLLAEPTPPSRPWWTTMTGWRMYLQRG